MRRGDRQAEVAAPGQSSMESLRRIERAERRLWLLALVLFLSLAASLLVLDATSVVVERLLLGMKSRIADLLTSYGASAALMTVVLLVCAYFHEKLAGVRNENRELVRALDTSARILAQRNQQLDTWNQLSHSLITNFNLPRLLDLIVGTAAEVTQSDCAVVMLKEEGSPHLRVAAIHQRGLQVELARRVAAIAIRGGEHLCLSPEELPEELDRPDLPWDDLVSLAAAPLAAADTTVGALLVGRVRPQEPFVPQIMDSLDSFASQASIALEKAQVYAENQRQLDRMGRLLGDLRATQDQLVASQRLGELGTLAKGVAYVAEHPVARIAERANDALEKPEWEEQAARADVAAIHELAGRSMRALRGFLDLSRERHTQESQLLDINRPAQKAVGLLREELEGTGIEVIESYEEIPYVESNCTQLEQILVGLLLDVGHTARCGGRVTVATSGPVAGWVELVIEARRGAGRADREDQEAIAVEQSKSEAGVEVIAQILHSDNAMIDADREPGKLMRYELRFPAAEAGAEEDEQGAAVRANLPEVGAGAD